MTEIDYMNQNNGVLCQNNSILIRTFTDSDFKGLYKLEIQEGLRDERDDATDEDIEWWINVTKKHYQSSNRRSINMAIVDSISGSFIGELTIQGYKYKTPEIGLTLNVEYQGKGLGAEIIKLYMKKCVEIREIDYFTAKIKAYNINSQKMISKLNSEMVIQIADEYCYRLNLC